MCVLPIFPALTATLSSPVLMKLRVIVTFSALVGSMPSVLRARGSRVSMRMPHTVKPDARSKTTWKFPEFLSVTSYNVASFDLVRTMRRGQLWKRLRTFASWARSHHDTFLPRTFAHPRPSIVPGPMMPTPIAPVAEMSGLHPCPFPSTVPQRPSMS